MSQNSDRQDKEKQQLKNKLKKTLANSSPVDDDTNKSINLYDYLVEEAMRLKIYNDEKKISEDSQAADRNAAIQHMYDTRREFIEDANRYYTHYLVVLAAALYSLKYAVDAEDYLSQKYLLYGTAILFTLIGVFVYTCKRLLQSVYYLYSASVVTAAIKSLATRDWSHAWFDSVKIVASRVERVQQNWWNSCGLGITPPRRKKTCPREVIANEWSAEFRSLLGINSVAHDALLVVLLLAAGFTAYKARSVNESKAIVTVSADPRLSLVSATDLEKVKKSLEDSLKDLEKMLGESKTVMQSIRRGIEEKTSVNMQQKNKLPLNPGN
jgi:hypothetical protein